MYNRAQVKFLEPNQGRPGIYRLGAVFTGNAGEAPAIREMEMAGQTSGVSVRQWAMAQIADLNGSTTISKTAGLQPGSDIDLTPIVATPPTAEQVWRQKVAHYLSLKPIGLTDAKAAADLKTLLDDINATYVSGY